MYRKQAYGSVWLSLNLAMFDFPQFCSDLGLCRSALLLLLLLLLPLRYVYAFHWAIAQLLGGVE